MNRIVCLETLKLNGFVTALLAETHNNVAKGEEKKGKKAAIFVRNYESHKSYLSAIS